MSHGVASVTGASGEALPSTIITVANDHFNPMPDTVAAGTVTWT
jgi:hypothetical protein